MSKKILFLFTLITFIISQFCFAARKTRQKTGADTSAAVSEESAEPSETQAPDRKRANGRNNKWRIKFQICNLQSVST